MHFSALCDDIRAFQKTVLAWYRASARDLPWRRSKDPYAIWVSEVMLQQTRVDTVIPYYHTFMQAWPDLAVLAEAEPEELLKSWEGLGYYRRLLHMQQTARILIQNGMKELPQDHAALRALPGIGDYIAAAVASIAFGKPTAVVDGNVKRVMARLFADPFPVNSGASHKHYARHATFLLNTDHPGDANQALMELGAIVCTPQRPECGLCPVFSFCEAAQQKTVMRFPLREKKKKPPFFRVACAAILDGNDRILVTKRAETGMLPGFWEFPGGKCEEEEDEKAACIREVLEETGIFLENPEKICTIRHAYTHFRIAMTLFSGRVRTEEESTDRLSTREHRWLAFSDIAGLPFPAANRKCMPLLAQWLKITSGPPSGQDAPASLFFEEIP